jgi:hypothetical protein
MSEELASALSGPAAISVAVTLGVTGRAKATSLAIGIQNTSDDAVAIERVGCDPIQVVATGAAAAGAIHATQGQGDAVDQHLAPGESATLTLRVEAPRRPGSYASMLRVKTQSGGSLVIPITVMVGASPVWGVAAMLAGLMLLALVNVLDGEVDLRNELHKVLVFRQDADERLERNPPPESQDDNRAAFEGNVKEAVQILTTPRQWSIADHRIEEARERRRAAEDDLKETESAVARSPAGAAQVAELDADWDNLRRRMAALAARADTAPKTGSETFAGRVAAMMSSFEKSMLGLAVEIDNSELAGRVGFVDLTLDAGRRDDANRSAVEVRRSLQRAAADLGSRLNLIERFEALAGVMVGEEALARQEMSDPLLDDGTRQALTKELDVVTAGISSGSSLADLKDAYIGVLRVGVKVLKARSDAVVARAAAAARDADAVTSLAPVEKAMQDNRPPKGAPVEMRAAALRKVLTAWDGPLSQADPATRNAAKADIAAIEALLDRGDLRATAPPYRRLIDAWTDYGLRRMNDAVRAATADYCRAAAADLHRTLARTERIMQLVPDHADRAAWERTLNRLRVEAGQVPMDGCMVGAFRRGPGPSGVEAGKASPLFGLAARALDLSQQVFVADLAAVSISAQDRLQAARASGVQRAETVAQSLLTAPRPLTIEAATPETERYAGRPVSFRVGGLDMSWEAGVQVAVDYGDGSPIETMSAEEARRRFFTHTYAAPMAPGLRVAAAFAFRPGTLEATEARLGEGRGSLTIERSPLSAARAAQDAFFNMRFALALAIAGFVYFWQFRTKEPTFGAGSFDYVKAFALGAAVEAAVTNLPEALSKIPLG